MDYQSRASRIGKAFRDTCDVTLAGMGWELLGPQTIPGCGVEVDQIAHNKHGLAFYFEYKGSTDGGRPGLQRSDSTKKALCNAFLLNRLSLAPFVILTSHKPEPGSSSDQMICTAGVGPNEIVFDVICPFDKRDVARLRKYLELEDAP